MTKARRKPYTPSPLATSPTPVSQADNTTNFVPRKLNPAASKAVKIPSSLPLFFGLAPARASPERSKGFSAFSI